MRLLTWNIHKGLGSKDRRYDPERMTTVLRHYQADLVLLQEVDDGVPRSGRDHQAAMLAEALGYPYWAFEPNVTLKRGRYGNATLSRHPIVFSSNVDLTFSVKKRRGALYSRVHAREDGQRSTLHIFNMHLGLSGVERRWQLRRLVEKQPMSHLRQGSRVILAGDTNDWMGMIHHGPLKDAGFTCVTGRGQRAIRTFPSRKPVGALDRVFVRGQLEAHRSFRSRMALAREASDHIPLVVDLSMDTGGSKR